MVHGTKYLSLVNYISFHSGLLETFALSCPKSKKKNDTSNSLSFPEGYDAVLVVHRGADCVVNVWRPDSLHLLRSQKE
jgi:hypothetical protein